MPEPSPNPWQIQEGDSRWIKMSNSLALSAQNLTLRAKRLTLIAIAHIKRNQRQAERTTITAKEYAETFNLDIVAAYQQLAGAADDFLRRYVTIEDDKGLVRKRPWVQECVYLKGEGKVEVEWSKYVAPHLIGLERRFTRFQMEQVRNLRSIYSVRLLELVSRFRDTGKMQIGIAEFGEAMGATEKQMSNFANVRRRMIEPAARELKEKDGLDVAWEPIKEGRKVTALRFTFASDKQKRLPLDGKPRPQGAAIAPRNMDKAQAESAAAASQAAQRARLPTQFVLDHSLPDEPFHVAELRLSLAIRKGEIQSPSKAQDK